MKQKIWTGIGAAAGMLILILDTKTAISGAQEGIRLCLMTVIPSLLPFFFLSILLTSSLTGARHRFLMPISKLMRIPAGSESLFLIGAFGGYPTGAIAVSKAYTDGYLSRRDGVRMLGFCSNAGPSFLFGIAAAAFSSKSAAWVLWLIHLLSAVAVAILLPGGSSGNAALPKGKPITLSQALSRSLTVMAQVCGWIIVFRIMLSFCNRWFLWFFDTPGQILINGFMELSIGCTALSYIPSEGLRFILCSAMLGFGGLCVTMQTLSAVGSLGLGMYLPGKILQCGISTLAAALFQQLTFDDGQRFDISPVFYLVTAAVVTLLWLGLQLYEKKSSNPAAVGV